MQFQRVARLVFAAVCLCGCSGESHEEIPFSMIATGKPATDIVRGPPLDADQKRFYSGTLVTSDWVDSGDRKLSLRISTWIVSGEGPFTLIAELRNNAKEPIEVLRPLGDRYSAACHIEIHGPSGNCTYSGPTWSHTLGASAFATIAPGEVLSDRAEFPYENYKNCGEQGVYQIRYRYVRENPRGHDGRGPLWQGEITSPELRTHVGRRDWRVFRGDGEFERSVHFVTRPYRFSQAEAAKGVTLKYELIVDRDFVACVDAERGSNDGSNAFPVFEVIHGGGHLYGYVNLPVPPATPPHYAGEAAKAYSRGRYRYEMKWDGRNWSGSGCDPEALDGPPFPPGEYQLTLTASGIVEESDGARRFELKAVTPVVITP